MTAPRTATLDAACLTTDGRLTPLTLNQAHILAGMYAAIGCDLVEPVTLSDRLTMWLDEEGMYTGRVNLMATLIAQRFGHTHQPYFGHAVFTGGVDTKGNTLPLTPYQVEWLTATCTG